MNSSISRKGQFTQIIKDGGEWKFDGKISFQ